MNSVFSYGTSGPVPRKVGKLTKCNYTFKTVSFVGNNLPIIKTPQTIFFPFNLTIIRYSAKARQVF